MSDAAFKDLRNEIAHEYESDDLQGIFGAVLGVVPELFAIAERILKYCARYSEEGDR